MKKAMAALILFLMETLLFYLYEMPLEAWAYSSVFILLIFGGWIILDGVQQRKKYKQLKNIQKEAELYLETEHFGKPENAVEKEYQNLAEMLGRQWENARQEARCQISEANRYYIRWSHQTYRNDRRQIREKTGSKNEENVMSKVKVMDHPLIQHKIGVIRRKDTCSKDFRTIISEIAMLMCYEATRELKLTDIEIETPICTATVKELQGKKLAVVPILRAGLGMVDGMLSIIPSAKIGHIGLYRDPKTLEPVEYYCKLPADSEEREVFVVDPMLATGGSATAAIQMLKDKGVKHIHFMCIIAAPEGVKKMQECHPDVDMYIGALDEQLNSHGYIVPGLGDAGDRIFGTK